MIRLAALWTIICLAAYSSTARAQVSGTVVDHATRLPISGAVVSLQATGPSTLTGPDGTFSLSASGFNLRIVGAKKGFYSASVAVHSPASGVEIQLEAVPQESDSTYEFVEPKICGRCHPTQIEHWNESPMAQAGQNTWVYDIYNGTGTPGGMGGVRL